MKLSFILSKIREDEGKLQKTGKAALATFIIKLLQSDPLTAMSYNTIHINPVSSEPSQGSVLVIYTGGTLGMVYETRGRQLVPFNFNQIIEKVPEIDRLNFAITFLSLHEPIDSSNINPQIWIELGTIIEENYNSYDSFVILHGTDTMAYTASALSFLLENLNKPVILTGAQLPIGVARSDARENFITALELAAAKDESGRSVLSEVCIFFNSLLLRGNRSKKRKVRILMLFIQRTIRIWPKLVSKLNITCRL